MEQGFKKQLKQILAENEKRFNEATELKTRADKKRKTMATRLNKLNSEEEDLCIAISEMEAELKLVRAEKKEIDEKIKEIDRELKETEEEDRKEREKMIREAAEMHLENRKMTMICVAWAEQRTRECMKCGEESGIDREMRYICKNNHIECRKCAEIGERCSECNEKKEVRIGEDLEKEMREQILLNEIADEKERLEKERLEKERLEKERLEKERLEKERLEKERLEKERLEKERLEKERLEKERLEKERLEKQYNKLRNEQLVQLISTTTRTKNSFTTTSSTFIEVNGESKTFKLTENKANKEENDVLWNNNKVFLEEKNWRLTITIGGKEKREIQGRFYEGSRIFTEGNSLYLKTNEWRC